MINEIGVFVRKVGSVHEAYSGAEMYPNHYINFDGLKNRLESVETVIPIAISSFKNKSLHKTAPQVFALLWDDNV